MGGRAPSLADDTWTFGCDDASIAASIHDGRANGAMPAFKASLSESQILALVPEPVAGLPRVWVRQDGGLMDVALHPDYAKNGWIYLSFSDPGPNGAAMTEIVRGRVREGKWVDQEVLRPAKCGRPSTALAGATS